MPVSLPVGMGPVTGLKVAPDGVRIALIVGQGASAHMMIGAITRSGGAVFDHPGRAARPRPLGARPP